MSQKTLADAFGGVATTLEAQRAIWADALHEDAIWEGPTFERPICMIGRRATGQFFELLLSETPAFTTSIVGVYPSADPDTMVIESHGGGPTTQGGRYTQRYLSIITRRDGLAFRMREYCNPFQTYRAYGKARWEAAVEAIMRDLNLPWPASQAPDRIVLPD